MEVGGDYISIYIYIYIYIYISLHCHCQNDYSIKMGSECEPF